MSDKSYVSMEQKMCAVTGKVYDTGCILMDRRVQDSMDRYTVTGIGISPKVQEQLDKGFVALIAVDPEKSDKPMTPSSVYRLGKIAYLKKHVAKEMFNIDISEHPFVFVEEDVIDILEQKSKGNG